MLPSAEAPAPPQSPRCPSFVTFPLALAETKTTLFTRVPRIASRRNAKHGFPTTPAEDAAGETMNAAEKFLD